MATMNLGPAKYMANKNAGANVAKTQVFGKTTKTAPGSDHVAKGLSHVRRVSVGKMASNAPGVSLGTFHGKHNVAHPVNGN